MRSGDAEVSALSKAQCEALREQATSDPFNRAGLSSSVADEAGGSKNPARGCPCGDIPERLFGRRTPGGQSDPCVRQPCRLRFCECGQYLSCAAEIVAGNSIRFC